MTWEVRMMTYIISPQFTYSAKSNLSQGNHSKRSLTPIFAIKKLIEIQTKDNFYSPKPKDLS